MNIFIEGAKRAGKTYLLSRYGNSFKIPFIDYFQKAMNGEGTGEGLPAAHWLNAGCDLAIMAMAKKKIFKDTLFDRGPLSNVVFAVLQKRVSEQVALKHLQYLADAGLFENFETVYVKTDKNVERSKDLWEDLSIPHQLELFEKYSDFTEKISGKKVIQFKNDFDENSVTLFKKLISTVRNEL